MIPSNYADFFLDITYFFKSCTRNIKIHLVKWCRFQACRFFILKFVLRNTSWITQIKTDKVQACTQDHIPSKTTPETNLQERGLVEGSGLSHPGSKFPFLIIPRLSQSSLLAVNPRRQPRPTFIKSITPQAHVFIRSSCQRPKKAEL